MIASGRSADGADAQAMSQRETVVVLSVLAGILAAIVGASWLGPRGLAVQLSVLAPFQIDLSSGSLALVLAFAFVAGVSMILTPCGYPLPFALTTASSKTRTAAWLRSLLPFAVGIFGAVALAGVVVSLAGRLVLTALLDATLISRVVLSGVVYGSLGILALLIGLRSLGVLVALPSLPGARSIGQLFSVKAVQARNFDTRMLAFGALFGGGMAGGCPIPSYWALLFWVAATGNPIYGGLVMGVHALGYAAPVLVIGILSRAGISLIRVLPRAGERLQRFVSAGLLTAGAFLVSLYLVIRVGTLLI